MTGFTKKKLVLAATIAIATTTSAHASAPTSVPTSSPTAAPTDVFIGSGTRCFRQSKCLDFKVSSCTSGNREICMWWNASAECDKSALHPFPDVCVYKPSQHDQGPPIVFRPAVKGVPTFSWHFGEPRKVCQTASAIEASPAVYFSVRGYVDCDGTAQELIYDLANPGPAAGVATCSALEHEMCDWAPTANTTEYYNEYARYWASRYSWTGGYDNYGPSTPGQNYPTLPFACQWKVTFDKCTLAPTKMPTSTPTKAPTKLPTMAPTKTPTKTPTDTTPTESPTEAPTHDEKVCVYGWATPVNYQHFDLIPMHFKDGTYADSEYGTVINIGQERAIEGNMYAYIPVPGEKLGTAFFKKLVGWFKVKTDENHDNTSLLKMGVKEGWWLDQVKFASTIEFPYKEIRTKFCGGEEGDEFPHVFNINTGAGYDPYGMDYMKYFKRGCLPSHLKDLSNNFSSCQPSVDKWGNKNCPLDRNDDRRLSSEESPVDMSVQDDDSIVAAMSENDVETAFLRGRKLYANDRQCWKHNRLMIRGHFCALHSTYLADKMTVL